MNSLTNKAFSDWYDSQHGEPSYQQTFEAGQQMARQECLAVATRINLQFEDDLRALISGAGKKA